jgi:hypothetical protein
VASIRPLYPDSSKQPAKTTVAYARRCRWRGKLNSLGSVSMPGVIQRNRELSMVGDTSIVRRPHREKDSAACLRENYSGSRQILRSTSSSWTEWQRPPRNWTSMRPRAAKNAQPCPLGTTANRCHFLAQSNRFKTGGSIVIDSFWRTCQLWLTGNRTHFPDTFALI